MSGFVWKEWIGVGTGVLGAVVAFWALQQTSELSVADYAERIRANELSIQNSTEQLRSAASELQSLTGRIEGLARDANREDLLRTLEGLQNRITELETRLATGGSGDFTAEDVAAVLASDYADVLQGPPGPRGPQGEQGPQGPVGEAGAVAAGPSGATAPDGPIIVPVDFGAEFEPQVWGSTEVGLLGCTRTGTQVRCDFVLRSAVDQPYTFVTFAEYTRIALQTGEWVSGIDATFNGRTSSRSQISMIPDVPVRLSIRYQSPAIGGEGIVALQLGQSIGDHIIWRGVPFSE